MEVAAAAAEWVPAERAVAEQPAVRPSTGRPAEVVPQECPRVPLALLMKE
jgi:hypothetical protein